MISSAFLKKRHGAGAMCVERAFVSARRTVAGSRAKPGKRCGISAVACTIGRARFSETGLQAGGCVQVEKGALGFWCSVPM
ncbi:MAG: hypothetical protein AB1547_04410 [Thermodesulfobacteriota bacterium]